MINKKKILVSTGIKSDYDILFPVLSEIRKDFSISIIVSGAHLSDQHNSTYKRIIDDGFEICEKIDTLLSTDRVVQRSKGVGLLIQGLTQTVERVNPDFLMVLGDREESIAVSIVGNYMNKLVIHIGGGDPVYGNADDPIRFATSKLSHIHFCFAKEYADNLIKIGEEAFRIFNVGNPAYANIDFVPCLGKEKIIDDLDIGTENYFVIIKHPLSSEIDDASFQMKVLMEAVGKFCEKYAYKAVYIPPNSDPGFHQMQSVLKKYLSSKWLVKLKTLPRLQFVNLMRNAKALVGNSSMGILEAPYYKLPVVNIGNRQKGRLNAGNVSFVPYDEDKIIESIKNAIFDKEYRKKIINIENPFGDGTAPTKIKNAILSIDLYDRKWYVKKELC